MAAGLTNMQKGRKKGKFKEKRFKMTSKVIKLFEKLKRYFQTALILVYFNPTKYSILETNTLDKALGAIFLQLIQKTVQ